MAWPSRPTGYGVGVTAPSEHVGPDDGGPGGGSGPNGRHGSASGGASDPHWRGTRPGVGAPGAVGAVEAMEAAVEGVPGAVSLAPSSVMPVLGGELVLPPAPTLVDGSRAPEGDVAADSVRSGLLQAGPLAVAGLVANGANVVVTVALARLLTTRGYGVLNQLTGTFLIVSTPGSAVIVAVVRRVTAWKGRGSAHLAQRWARRLHRQGLIAVVAFAVVVVAGSGPWLAGVLNQHDAVGDDAILVAGAVWILLCLDRGLLQAHRNYRALSVNLLVEGGVRSVGHALPGGPGAGAAGAAVAVLVAEAVTALHARVMADRSVGGRGAGGGRPGRAEPADRTAPAAPAARTGAGHGGAGCPSSVGGGAAPSGPTRSCWPRPRSDGTC